MLWKLIFSLVHKIYLEIKILKENEKYKMHSAAFIIVIYTIFGCSTKGCGE